MPIKRLSSKKFKKSSKSSKSRKTKNFRSSRKLKTFRKNKMFNSKSKSKSRTRRYQKGGRSCNLATVQEPAFNVDALGSMAGLSVSASSAAIYRPNCKTNSSSQAMVP